MGDLEEHGDDIDGGVEEGGGELLLQVWEVLPWLPLVRLQGGTGRVGPTQEQEEDLYLRQ